MSDYEGLDWISVTGITATGYHGVFDFERQQGQVFIVDVRLGTVFTKSDDLSDTINYAEIADLVVSHIVEKPVQLIETLAQRIADDILANPRVSCVEIVVKKPQAPLHVEFEQVSVSIRRPSTGFNESLQGPIDVDMSSIDGDASSLSLQTEDRESPIMNFTRMSDEFEAEVNEGSPVDDSNPADSNARVVLSLGSNLGDRVQFLRNAVRAIDGIPGVKVEVVSRIYETDPMDVSDDQPQYLNLVAILDTQLLPNELLVECQRIELEQGRVREGIRTARTLDIDIVDFDGRVDDDPVLTLPHPRASQRAFVLMPWVEVDNDAILPGYGRVSDRLERIGTHGVVLTDLEVDSESHS